MGTKRHRRPPSKSVEADLLLASRRRCCLCVFLENDLRDRRGQVAHLNRDASDSRVANLVWLCLEHHDEFDSKPSQSKGLTIDEVRRYRNLLHAQSTKFFSTFGEAVALPELAETTVYAEIRLRFPKALVDRDRSWRYPLWLVANEPTLFAYKAPNRCDGICVIERIDLPDDRVVIACSEVVGNPGQSTTNAIEDLCFQVCERFAIPPASLVWLDHYDDLDHEEWNLVEFGKRPPDRPFEDPKWLEMTADRWKDLRLSPRRRFRREPGHLSSALVKHFSWPTQGIVDDSKTQR